MTITKRVIATRARCRLSKNKRKDVERRKTPKEKKIGATFREIRESWLPFFFPFSLFAYPRCRSRYVATSRLAKDHGNGCESNKPCWKKRQDFAWYAMELSRRIRPARFLRRGGQPDAMLHPRIIPNICLSLSFSLILPSPTRKRNQTKTIQTANYNNKKITMQLYHYNVHRLPDIVTACITVQNIIILLTSLQRHFVKFFLSRCKSSSADWTSRLITSVTINAITSITFIIISLTFTRHAKEVFKEFHRFDQP